MDFFLLAASTHGSGFLSPTIEAAGWTLLHFVWQGAALAVLLWSFLALTRRVRPNVRYLAGCAALTSMCLAVGATFSCEIAALPQGEAAAAIPTGPIVPPRPRATHSSPTARTDSKVAALTSVSIEYSFVREHLRTPLARIPRAEPAAALPQSAIGSVERLEALAAALRPWLAWLVGLWGAGVGVFSLRLAVGWRAIRRLRAEAIEPEDSTWRKSFDGIRGRLGVPYAVRLVASASATVPMVIGWLRPVVLVPAGLLTGLTSAQIEALFAHELAHIRRHDFLANLVQNIVETLLFYHPAVWWVSAQVRAEREHCCDDMASAMCGGVLDYARALTALAELRSRQTALGLAVNGGSLVARIRRLAGVSQPSRGSEWTFAVLMVVGAAVTSLVATGRSVNSAPPNPKPNAATPPTNTTTTPSRTRISGRLLDYHSDPVANATVWLAARVGRRGLFDPYPVIAHVRSSADGHFELTLGDSDPASAPNTPRDFQIWIRKPGLALTRFEYDGELPDRPIDVRMNPEAPATIRLHKPDGSLCANAIVMPCAVRSADRQTSMAIPFAVQKELKGKTRSDGQLAIPGMAADESGDLQIESAECGVQFCRFAKFEWPDSESADLTLRGTGSLEGRLIAPAGSQPDFSRVKLHVWTDFRVVKPNYSVWQTNLTIQPENDGRFKIPKISEGTIQIAVDVPDDFGFRTDDYRSSSFRRAKQVVVTPGKTSKVDLALWKSARITRVIRDFQTKVPLTGVHVIFSRADDLAATNTDIQGRMSASIRPDFAYAMSIHLPPGYVRQNSSCSKPIRVPRGADRIELEPVELVKGRTIEGAVVDTAGRPLADIRVDAEWRRAVEVTDPKEPAIQNARRSATTDAQGRFRFDALASDVEITLRPVRAGIGLADPTRVAPGSDQSVRLQTKALDFGSFGGRVVDRRGSPVGAVTVVIQRVRPPGGNDPGGCNTVWRGRTDASGQFQTPPWFPKESEYRMTVRSSFADLASSVPIRPTQGNARRVDVVVDRPKPTEPTKLTGLEVVANVNGEPILAGEIFRRWYTNPVPPGELSLMVATPELANGRLTEREYRQIQVAAIGHWLKEHVKRRLLSQAILDKLDHDQRRQSDEAITRMFEEYAGKLAKDLKVASMSEVDAKLQNQGTSLADLKQEFRQRMLADEYLRSATRPTTPTRDELRAYYQAHLRDYSVPEKVRWQLLEISFARHGGRQRAGVLADKALNDLRHGADFGDIVREYSDGPGSDDGGEQPWTALENTENEKFAAAIREVLTGKPVFDGAPGSEVKLGLPESPPKPHKVIADAATTLRRAEMGGREIWTNLDNVADYRLAVVLWRLAPGEVSPVFEGPDSFRIVRLTDRKPAGRKPFDEVEPSIRRMLETEATQRTIARAVEALYRQAVIESPYLANDGIGAMPDARALNSPVMKKTKAIVQ